VFRRLTIEIDLNFGLEMLGTQTQPAAPQAPHDGVVLRSRNTDALLPTHLSMRRQDYSRVSPGSQGSTNGPGSGMSNQRASGCESVRVTTSTHTCLPAASPSTLCMGFSLCIRGCAANAA
jgi:hypothetical protein